MPHQFVMKASRLLPCLLLLIAFPLTGQEVLDSTVRYFKYEDAKGVHHQRCVTRIVRTSHPPVRLNPRGIQRVRNRGTSFELDALKAGDTLVLSVRPEAIKKLRKITLLRNEEVLLEHYLRMQDTLVITEGGALQLRVKSKGWFFKKKYANIELTRIPPHRLDTLHRIYDTTYTPVNRPGPIQRDTTWVLLADTTLRLNPERQIESRPSRSLKIDIPLAQSDTAPLQYLGLWVGWGGPTLQAYQTLEADIPEEWGRPGVPAALAAYCLGYQNNLPANDAGDITFAFTDLHHKNKFLDAKGRPAGLCQSIPLPGGPEDYGCIRRAQLQYSCTTNRRETESLEIYFSAFNHHTVNRIPVTLKMLGIYISNSVSARQTAYRVKEINIYSKPCK